MRLDTGKEKKQTFPNLFVNLPERKIAKKNMNFYVYIFKKRVVVYSTIVGQPQTNDNPLSQCTIIYLTKLK